MCVTCGPHVTQPSLRYSLHSVHVVNHHLKAVTQPVLAGDEAEVQGMLASGYVWLGAKTLTTSIPDVAPDPVRLATQLRGFLSLNTLVGIDPAYLRLAEVWRNMEPSDCERPGLFNVSASVFLSPPSDVASHAYDCVAALALVFDQLGDLSNTTGAINLLANLEFQGATGLVDFDPVTLDRDTGSVRYQVNGFLAPSVGSSSLLRGSRVAIVDLETRSLTCARRHHRTL